MQRSILLLVWFWVGLVRADSSIQLIHSGNRAGEIEPCGCRVHQIGGLNRMAAWIENAGSKTPTIVLDSGDTFFSAVELSPFRTELEKKRAILIAESYQNMRLAALTPGERDFALGLDFLRDLEKKTGAVFVSANLTDKDGKLLFPEFTTIKRGEKSFAVIGLSGEEALSSTSGMPDTIKVSSPIPALEKTLEKLTKENVTATVLLSHLGMAGDREIQKRFPSLLILGAHSLDVLAESHLVQEQHEGQQIASVSFLDGWQKPLLVDLTKDWDKNNATRKRMEKFKKEKSDMAEKAHVGKGKTNKAYVARPFLCKSCHEEQYQFWAGTKHASAVLVLFAKKQHKDPECIGCHSLGYREPAGYAKFAESIQTKDKKKGFAESLLQEVFAGDEKTPLDSRENPARHKALHLKYLDKIHSYEEKNQIVKNYLGVQCEHCHGNRSGHPANMSGKTKVQESSCRTCHRPPNAPEFDPAMIKQVACPPMQKESNP